MSMIQWVFHYHEIMKHKQRTFKTLYDVLHVLNKETSLDLSLLGMVIDYEKGKNMFDIKQDIEKQKNNNISTDKPSSNTNNYTNSEHPNQQNNTGMKEVELTEKDKELLEFFNSVPKTKQPSKKQLMAGKFCLPTVDITKMQLGISKNVPVEERGEV